MAEKLNDAKPTFLTLPPEVRHAVYCHLELCIVVTRSGKLDTTRYPLQLTVTCKRLREETVPVLRNTTPSSNLELVCEDAHFPDSIRRRLPDYIFLSIRTITIMDTVNYADELKPTKRTFPNLVLLYFDLSSDKSGKWQWDESLRILTFPGPPLETLLIGVMELSHKQLESPREGLERDYFVEDSLWDVCQKGRKGRGFAVAGQLRLLDMEDVQKLDLERYLPE